MKPPPNGFTLIEVLISLAIFAMILILISGGVRFGLRTWETGTDRLDSMSQVGTVQHLLRRELAVAALPRRERRNQLEREPAMFLGTNTSIRFVGTLPIHEQTGRYYTLNVETYPSGDHQALVLSWRPFGSDRTSVTEEGQAEATVLLDRVGTVEFAFFGGSDGGRPPGWLSEWIDPRTLPQLVRMRVSFPPGDERRWPDLIVAPRLSFRQ